LQSKDSDASLDYNWPEIDLSHNPLDFPFTCKEVKLGISKLKNNKSAGPDLI
jgi:hypothetical protein